MTDPDVGPSAPEPSAPSGRERKSVRIGSFPVDLPTFDPTLFAPSGIPFASLGAFQYPTPSDLEGLQFHIRSDSELRLEEEIVGLKKKLDEQKQAVAASEKMKEDFQILQQTLATLKRKETLSSILYRIHEDARDSLLNSEEFQGRFLNEPTCHAYVLSIDIRRSTELMLKARTAELFAQFIQSLCSALYEIVLRHNGIFDKFTGDGILAFFPEFYTGAHAGYHVVAASDECHRAFNAHYTRHRQCFNAVLRDVGLGIGVDCGEVRLVRVGEGLTAVGIPVVYACRLGGGSPGMTLLNQAAYEDIFVKFSAYCTFEQAELEVKHEGVLLGHSVRPNGKEFTPEEPSWRKYLK